MSLEKKTTLSFGFAKTKPKSTLATTSAFGCVESQTDESKNIELITSIEDKRLNFVNKEKNESTNKPVIIPCPENQSIDRKKAATIDNEKPACSKTISDSDLEAVKALRLDLASRKEASEKKDINIELSERSRDVKKNDLDKIEQADYEQVDLEQFGKAALRGMGWNEKEGIGLTNKRTFKIVEPELRPKGLGLGAGISKRQRIEDENDPNALKFVKGAYVKIIGGKNKNEIGEILSFNEALNRVLIKLPNSEKNLTVIQNYTQLLSKTEYENLVKERIL